MNILVINIHPNITSEAHCRELEEGLHKLKKSNPLHKFQTIQFVKINFGYTDTCVCQLSVPDPDASADVSKFCKRIANKIKKSRVHLIANFEVVFQISKSGDQVY